VEGHLAALIGCQRAMLATSTLHVFWDLFTLLARAEVNIFLDAGTYPIVRWGVNAAACSGASVKTFRQHDPEALGRALESADARPPVIVADGYCPGCGRLAPIAEYLALAVARGGSVVIDDSQAMGIFGRPAGQASYGTGGGGSMQRAAIARNPATANSLIVCSSLAKAFGVPAAVLAGSEAAMSRFETGSKTRVHCSPPSAADIAACGRALQINHTHGDRLRRRLAQRVSQLREELGRLGLIGVPGLFPVQPLRLPLGVKAMSIHERLSDRGVSAVLQRGQGGRVASISFIVTAQHTEGEIDTAVSALADALAEETKKATGKDRTSWPTQSTTQRI